MRMAMHADTTASNTKSVALAMALRQVHRTELEVIAFAGMITPQRLPIEAAHAISLFTVSS